MTSILIFDPGKFFALWLVLCAVVFCGLLYAVDRIAQWRRRRAKHVDAAKRVDYLMRLGGTASVVLFLQSNGKDLSTVKRNQVEVWLQQQARENNDD